LIQDKLTVLDEVLHTVSKGRVQAAPVEFASSPLTGTGLAQYTSPFISNDSIEAEASTFEGESSLHAHSVLARELLEQAVRDSAFTVETPEMSSAISSLRQLASTSDNISATERGSLHRPMGEAWQDLRKLPLPPTNAVIDILRRSKGFSGTFQSKYFRIFTNS
jgi:hypothetical protein